jgi:DNA-binding NtrC family response regulator
MQPEVTYHWPTKERELIVKALNKYRGAMSIEHIAEKVLGISYPTLHRKIKEYKIIKYRVTLWE